jgi:hypothetical protein
LNAKADNRPKHLFYKNISEWDSEVSILRRADELPTGKDDSNRDHDDILRVNIYIDLQLFPNE